MTTIIHRGTLTKDKLKELCETHFEVKSDSDIYNPSKNPNTISITQQEDGNWTGKAIRHGNVVEVRAGDPNSILLMILTHS